MKIEIWSDFSCPFCYIGKKRFESALQKFEHSDEVDIVFKAYQLNPAAEKNMDGDAYNAFAKNHHMTLEEAKKRLDATTQNAKSVGLDFRYDLMQMTNTFDAHRLAKWANQFGLEQKLTDRLMKAYFTEGYNLSDVDTLVQLAVEVGLNGDEARKILVDTQYSNDVRHEINEAKRIGVQGVPFFVVNRKYGISGAQQEEYFLAALEQIWEEDHPQETLTAEEEAGFCTDESCSV